MSQPQIQSNLLTDITNLRNRLDSLERKIGSNNLVTSLPSNPYDGQEIYYDAGDLSVWHLRYMSSLVGTSKWIFVGGNPLADSWNGTQVGTNSNYENLSNADPTRVVLPLAGDYDFRYGATLQETAGSAVEGDVFVALINTATATAVVTENAGWNRPSGAFRKAAMTSEVRVSGLAAGTSIDARGKVNSASFASFSWYTAFLRATPVRVG